MGFHSAKNAEARADLKIRELDPGYTAEVDAVDEEKWYQLLREFDDANIYQAWAYATVICGPRNMSHVVVKQDGEVVAIAQARIAKLPFLKFGIAYIHWGPLWRRRAHEANPDRFRQAVRALRNEFVCQRGLALRMFPVLFENESPCFPAILAEEGFESLRGQTVGRTLLIPLQQSLPEIRQGMARNWKRNLKAAEQNELEVVEGTSDALFQTFIDVYQEMADRKRFVEPNDIRQFRLIQARLPENLRMGIMLIMSGECASAGLIWSEIGLTGIELFAATSSTGTESKGSYLLRWMLVEKLKQSGHSLYNLNGINPTTNPGSYQFKSGLAGKNGIDVHYLGRFESHAGPVSRWCLEFSERLRRGYRMFRERARAAPAAKPPGVPAEADEPCPVAGAPGPAAR